jgi:hypothetical protein
VLAGTAAAAKGVKLVALLRIRSSVDNEADADWQGHEGRADVSIRPLRRREEKKTGDNLRVSVFQADGRKVNPACQLLQALVSGLVCYRGWITPLRCTLRVVRGAFTTPRVTPRF